MDPGALSQTLPEDLVEKIIARISFPDIFKARGLSRSWLAKFSSLSSQSAECKEGRATAFQKEVHEQSKTWESFSLVYLGKADLLAYNRASQQWRRSPSLSFLPERMRKGQQRYLARSYIYLEGPLLFGKGEGGMYVANVLTRNWKLLPPSGPIQTGSRVTVVVCYNLLVDSSGDRYKLILFCQDGFKDNEDVPPNDLDLHAYLRIYDSKLNSWTSKTLDRISPDFVVAHSTSVCLNGVMYMVSTNNPQNLLAINIEEGTLQELSLSFEDSIDMVSISLVVCKKDWLVIVTKGLYPETLQLLKVDLVSLRLVELATGPPAALNARKILAPPVGDGSCIFFRVEEPTSRVLTYDVDDNEWNSFTVPTTPGNEMRYKWLGSSFKPGLSPFVVV